MVPEVNQELVDNKAAAAVASANSDINHNSIVNPTGPAHMITDYFLKSETASEKEVYSEIYEVDVPALDPDYIINVVYE